MPLLPPERRRNTLSFQTLQKCLLLLVVWALPGKPLNRVVRNQVHFSVQLLRHRGERLYLIEPVIYARDQDVLERYHPPAPGLVILARRRELPQRVFAID